MLEELKFKRALKKSVKEIRKKYEAVPFLIPSTVSIEKWLERYQGDTSRLDWLYSEMLDYAAESESAGKCLYLDIAESGAISLRLDEVGIFWFMDILQEFFSSEEVENMFEYLKSKNAIIKVYQDVKDFIETMNPDDLKEYRRKWESIQDNSETAEEVKNNVFMLIDAELNSRKG